MTQIIRPSETDPFIASILNKLARGRITQAEARTILKCSRWTINRYCKRYDLDPKRARDAYLVRLMKLSAWLGRRYGDGLDARMKIAERRFEETDGEANPFST